MNGFGFIQYDNEADAKDVVPGTKKIILALVTLASC